MAKEEKRLVLIDVMSLLHRAYHAYPQSLSTKDGELTNAVYGFTNMLLSVMRKLKPTHIAVAWDVGKPTFRHEEYEGYKESREKPDEELLGQIERTEEVIDSLNIPQFGLEGYEADDLIGSLSKQGAEKEDAEVVIVSGDRDALQLVEDNKVKVWMPAAPGRYSKNRGPKIYNEEAVKAKYGLGPEQLIDLKALMGDSSDDIPGIKGIGKVTATKLMKKYGSLDNIYEALGSDEGRKAIEDLVGARFAGLLESGKESAYMSRMLGEIKRDVPIELSWSDCKVVDYDKDKASELFTELDFKSLLGKLPADSWDKDLEEVFLAEE